MGCEFAQGREWASAQTLDWYVLDYPLHQGVHQLVKDLNRFYRTSPALYHDEFDWRGFEWIDCQDADQSVLSFVRQGDDQHLVVVLNFTPVPRYGYRIGVPEGGPYQEVMNSDSEYYGGSNLGNGGSALQVDSRPWMGREFSLELDLPPLAGIILRPLD
jgi:1,4-alpha-glucan branching enzyme